MVYQSPVRFVLPDMYLNELPTGEVKSAVDAIGRKIASGEFAEGSTIPVEAEICEMLDVSRTVVREAIKVISGKGMLRTARRYGTRVMPFENWNLLDPDVIMMHAPESPRATDIYVSSTKLRHVFEPAAAGLAAVNGTDEQLNLILTSAHGITPDPHGPSGMIAADYSFHATILEASGNLMLSQMRGLLFALLNFSYPTGAKRAPEAGVDQDLHVWVAEAIVARDAVLAETRMRTMLDRNNEIAQMIVDAEPARAVTNS